MVIAHAPSPSTAAPRAAAPAPASRPAGRDSGIDLVRALCLVVIMVLHALQVSATTGVSGPQLEYATSGTSWYPPLTWLLQVMPLFFVIGGFAGAIAHRRRRARGAGAASFVVGRVHRLLVPATATIAAAGLALAMLLAAGVPAELVGEIGVRFGEPLWFLGVFLGAQAVLPALLGAHERAPLATLLALASGAVAVDVLARTSGIGAIGYANLALVWLALQQLGFFLAEGRLEAVAPRWRALGGAGAIALLVVAVGAGAYSPDLIANMNPPTAALLLLGAAQTAALSLLRAPLAVWSRRPRVAAFTEFVTARSMTMYLWNLPVLLVMAGASVLLATSTGRALPAPSSGAWWLTRPLWIALALALTAAAGLLLGRLERLPPPAAPTTSQRRAAQAVLLALAGVLLLLVAGTSPGTVPLALGALVLALSRLR
ncbi:acyltransferase [Brachybacterium sp. YJGR34]|uniref:acyltransferase family protein n=1 Tax=Brachybacterium sp. YJGR34 TaxID=2059911 RepID=UPI000E0B25B4|nr:acyltransferase [Brachybacterium sp. YJGR34]